VPSLLTTFDRAPRFILLLAMILLELMLAPLFAKSDLGLHVAQAMAVFLMLAALWAAGTVRGAVLLFAPTVAMHLLFVYQGGDVLRAASLLFRTAFFAYMTGLIMWRTARELEVSLDTIAGAACAYTLLAVVWAGMYAFLEVIHPGSFNIPDVWRSGSVRDVAPALAYFSFVTLTTVGYGDITPVWPGAAGLAVTEAVVGQLYLAITIARLVGVHASRRR